MNENTPPLIPSFIKWANLFYKKIFTTKPAVADKQKLEISNNPKSVNIVNNYFINNVEIKK